MLNSILSLPGWTAYAAMGLVVLVEAGAFIGLVLPGETALLIGGALAATGRLSLPVVLAVGILAAVVGDTVGYELGRLSGGRLRATRFGLLIGARRWDRAEDLVARRGGYAVAAGRWVGVARALVPALVGATRMRYRTFLLWNAAGGVTWATAVVLAGYAAGASWPRIAHLVGRAAAMLAAVVVLAAVLALASRWVLRHPDRVHGAARRVARLAVVRWLVTAIAWSGRQLDPRTATGLVLTAGSATLAATAAAFAVVYDAVLDGNGVAAVDRPVHDWLAAHREPTVTTAMRVVTDFGGTPVLIAVAVLVAALAGRRARSWRPVLLVAVTACGSTLITVAGKAAVHRGRPSVGEAAAAAGGYSFPSGHSLNSSAVYGIATVLVWQLARRRRTKVWSTAGTVLLVLLIGASRMYLGVHWLTDVLAAYALALGWLAFTVTTVETIGRLPGRRAVSRPRWPGGPISAGTTSSVGTGVVGSRPVWPAGTGDAPGGSGRLPATVTEGLEGDRGERDEHDEGDHRQQVPVDVRDGAAEDVSGDGDAGRPQQTAEQLPAGEHRVRHPHDAGQRVENRTDQRYEPGQHDRLSGPVLLQERPGPVGRRGQPGPLPAAQEQRPGPPADQVAGLGAGEGAGRGGGYDRGQRQAHGGGGAGRSEQAGGEQQRVARQEQPDQQPRLGEQDGRDPEDAEAAQHRRRVEQVDRGAHRTASTRRLPAPASRQ